MAPALKRQKMENLVYCVPDREVLRNFSLGQCSPTIKFSAKDEVSPSKSSMCTQASSPPALDILDTIDHPGIRQ